MLVQMEYLGVNEKCQQNVYLSINKTHGKQGFLALNIKISIKTS